MPHLRKQMSRSFGRSLDTFPDNSQAGFGFFRFNPCKFATGIDPRDLHKEDNMFEYFLTKKQLNIGDEVRVSVKDM